MPSDPTSSPRCFALVPCAGGGSRAASALAKQYVAIDGMAVVSHTLAALALERIGHGHGKQSADRVAETGIDQGVDPLGTHQTACGVVHEHPVVRRGAR